MLDPISINCTDLAISNSLLFFFYSASTAEPELRTQSEAIPPYNIDAKSPDQVYMLKDSERKLVPPLFLFWFL